MKGVLIVLALLLISFPLVASSEEGKLNHLPLLAVQELQDGSYQGSTADLFLEVRVGSGRVFLDTSPLTKIDTQISTRYAKEIACDYFDLDCDHYDFIYTIRAHSNIIGGPSAGAAIAALTTLTVLDLEYDESVAITGTINSGGIVGPVGGVKEKIEAAAEQNLSKVLISLGSSDHEFESEEADADESAQYKEAKSNPLAKEDMPLFNANPYDNLIDYGTKGLGIEVEEVSDLNDVLFHLTGIELRENNFDFEVDGSYNQIMKSLETDLCERSDNLESELQALFDSSELSLEEKNEIRDVINERRLDANAAQNEGDHYSAASFCFGLNVYLGTQNLLLSNLSDLEIFTESVRIEGNVTLLSGQVESEVIETISDLQTKMIVEERLLEVLTLLEDANESNHTDIKISSLAFARERLNSATSWMQFFSMEGKLLLVDDIILADVCQKKLEEAQERFQYVGTYLSELDLSDINRKIERAQFAQREGDHSICLMQASQAKAESSTILSSLGINDENFAASLESRSRAVERIISENVEEGFFPILGFSYYQYANTLGSEEMSYSSLLYLEYALELSDLDIYFPEQRTLIQTNFEVLPQISTFVSGFFQGLLVGMLFMWLLHQGRRKKYH